jgi:hypothetical protein
MDPIDVDAIAGKMPPWQLRVKIGGRFCDILQPTLEQDEKLSKVDTLPDAEVYELFWALLGEPRPPKSKLNRDYLIVLFAVLLRYRRVRYTPAMAAAVLPDEYTRAAANLLKNLTPIAAAAAAAAEKQQRAN